MARYVRYPDDPADAEPAVTVVDHWQGRGLGSILLEEITGRARAAGVERFTAVVLASNEPMIAMLEDFGTDLETKRAAARRAPRRRGRAPGRRDGVDLRPGPAALAGKQRLGRGAVHGRGGAGRGDW